MRCVFPMKFSALVLGGRNRKMSFGVPSPADIDLRWDIGPNHPRRNCHRRSSSAPNETSRGKLSDGFPGLGSPLSYVSLPKLSHEN